MTELERAELLCSEAKELKRLIKVRQKQYATEQRHLEEKASKARLDTCYANIWQTQRIINLTRDKIKELAGEL